MNRYLSALKNPGPHAWHAFVVADEMQADLALLAESIDSRTKANPADESFCEPEILKIIGQLTAETGKWFEEHPNDKIDPSLCAIKTIEQLEDSSLLIVYLYTSSRVEQTRAALRRMCEWIDETLVEFREHTLNRKPEDRFMPDDSDVPFTSLDAYVPGELEAREAVFAEPYKRPVILARCGFCKYCARVTQQQWNDQFVCQMHRGGNTGEAKRAQRLMAAQALAIESRTIDILHKCGDFTYRRTVRSEAELAAMMRWDIANNGNTARQIDLAGSELLWARIAGENALHDWIWNHAEAAHFRPREVELFPLSLAASGEKDLGRAAVWFATGSKFDAQKVMVAGCPDAGKDAIDPDAIWMIAHDRRTAIRVLARAEAFLVAAARFQRKTRGPQLKKKKSA
jgi:hypothetical protein